MPVVSVIIPTYNRRMVIERAINSVLNQTFQDFEILVIDDDSSDNTESTVNRINDKRIFYYKHAKNLGPAAARNTGLKIAKGDYFAFLDSDDEWMLNKLENQMSIFKNSNPNLGLVYVKSVLHKRHKLRTHLPYNWLQRNEGFIYQDLLKLNFIDTPATMIKKEVINEVGMFDENFQCLEDYDLFLRIAKKYEIALVNEDLLITHYSFDGVNEKNLLNHAETLLKITEKHIEDYREKPSIYANRLMIIADLFFQAKDLIASEKYFVESLSLDKFNWKARLLFSATKMIKNKSTKPYYLLRSFIIRLNHLLTGNGGLY